MLDSARDSLEYWAEALILDFTEEIVRLMDEKGISRGDLARKIDTSQAYITKVLRGNANFTLTTMAKLARALDTVVRVHLAPDNVLVRWDDEQVTADTEIRIYQKERPAYIPGYSVVGKPSLTLCEIAPPMTDTVTIESVING